MKHGRLAVLWTGVFLLAVGSAPAQQRPADDQPVPPVELTIEAIEAQIKKLDAARDLDESIKTKLLGIYQQTIEQLRAADESKSTADQLTESARGAPDLLKAIKADLAEPPLPASPEVPPGASLQEMQQLMAQADTRLAEAEKELAEIEGERKRRAERRLEIPKLLDAARQQLQEVQRQLAAKPATDEQPDVAAATVRLLEARKRALVEAIRAYEQEPLTHETRAELAAARRDKVARQVGQAERLVKAWRELINERRRRETEDQAREAQAAEAVAHHPQVRQLAQENTDLTELRRTLAGKLELATHEFEQMDGQIAAIESQFTKIQQRVETGLTQAVGMLLRKHRDDLPNVREHQRALKARQSEIARVHLELIEREEQRASLVDPEHELRAVLAEMDGAISPDERDYIEAEVRKLLVTQRDYLGSLNSDTRSYLEKLYDLDTRQQLLIKKVKEQAAYCDERVLWIRSASAPTLAHVSQFGRALVWIASPIGWFDVLEVLWLDLLGNPALVGPAVLVAALLFLSQRTRRRRLRELGEAAAKSHTTTVMPTVTALLFTVLVAVVWPAVLWFVGWRLVVSEHGSEFAKSVGSGLQSTAVVCLTLELLRQVCRKNGLGDAHFGWSQQGLLLLRGTLWRFSMTSLPLIFLVETTESQGSEACRDSLGRVAFIGVLSLLAVAAHRLLRPVGGALETLSVDRQSWSYRLRRVWQLLAIGAPAGLAALAAIGYYYTARELASRLLASLWLILALVVLNALALRWFLVAYRHLAMKRSRERRAATDSAAAKSADSVTTPPAQPEVKLADINLQTRKLLRYAVGTGLVLGMWFIWVDVLPALGVLRRVELWPATVTLSGALAGTKAATAQWVTLADLVLAVLIAIVTFAASKNIPGLLEITVLQRLPLDPGGRYAVSTISRYLITVAGLVVAFGTVGVGWSQVQWLVAAMTVGLGFGLQEIFANFISGLILLFERPIRVGDIVTVGDVTGTVSRIRMRATTITDWDMRELVVPNKEFITGRVMNWTLSDTLSRMTINVGIAYGSDTERAHRLLLQVAHSNPLVLKEPPPHALFDGFGASTLDFTLRVYMATRDVYIQLRHELHTAIDKAFRDAGIEIAFPQQDVHVRSIVPALSIVNDRRKPRGASANADDTPEGQSQLKAAG